MEKIRAAITGVGGYVPPKILSNQDLEKMMDTSDEWIRSRTGIQERRLLENGQGSSVLGIHAVNELLNKTNTNPADIELIICATVTGDYIFPDTANLIAHECKLVNAFSFDLSAACSGFLFAMTTGAKYIESGIHKKVIVVGCDKMSSIIDYEDRTTSIIFGDGGGAVLLEPNKEFGYQNSYLRSDGIGHEHLYIKSGGSVSPSTIRSVTNKEHFVVQNGRPVFKAAVKGMSSAVQKVLENNNLTKEDVNWIVPHQANIRIIEAVSSKLKYPLEKVLINIHKYGNTTAGTIPLCLWDFEKHLKKGDNIILTAFGGGFTWGASYLTWAYDS